VILNVGDLISLFLTRFAADATSTGVLHRSSRKQAHLRNVAEAAKTARRRPLATGAQKL
jgi:hypothetical protein